MKNPGLATAFLRALIALRAVSPVGAAAAVVLAAALAATAAIGAARRAEAAAVREALVRAAPPARPSGGALTRTADDVSAFYGALGDVRYGEQQVRTLL